MMDSVKRDLKFTLINTLYTALTNTQSNLAVSGSKEKIKKLRSYFNLIYPYALLAFQCVYGRELSNVAQYEVLYEGSFKIKVKIAEKSFENNPKAPLAPLSNEVIPEPPNAPSGKRLAYAIFLVNIMAFYDADPQNYKVGDVLLKLILLLFGKSADKLLIPPAKNKSGLAEWKITKLRRNTLVSLTDVLEYIYGENGLKSKLEKALFDSYAMLWHLSGEPDELDFKFIPKPERFGFLDITTLIRHLSQGEKLDVVPTTHLPILMEKVKTTQKSESDQVGYYNILFSAFIANNYSSSGVSNTEEEQRTGGEGQPPRAEEKLKNKSVVIDT